MVTNLPVKMHCNWGVNDHQRCCGDGDLTPEPFHKCGQLVNGEPPPYIQAMQVFPSRRIPHWETVEDTRRVHSGCSINPMHAFALHQRRHRPSLSISSHAAARMAVATQMVDMPTHRGNHIEVEVHFSTLNWCIGCHTLEG